MVPKPIADVINYLKQQTSIEKELLTKMPDVPLLLFGVILIIIILAFPNWETHFSSGVPTLIPILQGIVGLGLGCVFITAILKLIEWIRSLKV